MLLLCISAYLVAGLLFSSLYWMSVAVGKKHDEKNGYSQIDAHTESGT
jgi:hypothetical protein